MSSFTDRISGSRAALAWKTPCRVATTGNITLSGEQLIDGLTTSEDRVLVRAQDDQTENGIYNTGTGVWTRAKDFDGNDDVVKGTRVFVHSGDAMAGVYYVSAADPVEIDSSSITFSLAPETVDESRLDDIETQLDTIETNLGSTVLSNLLNIVGFGFIVRTASSTWANRTITSADGSIAITDGNGVSANPTIMVPTHGITKSKMATGTASTYAGWDSSGEFAEIGAITQPTVRLLGKVSQYGSGLARHFVISDTELYGVGAANLSGYPSATDVPVRVAFNVTPARITKVISSAASCYVLDANGVAYSFGSNAVGQLGHNDTTARSVATRIEYFVTNSLTVSDIYPSSAGGGAQHYCFFKCTNGKVYACGDNTNGQLGDGSTTQRNQPVEITAVTNVSKIIPGNDNTSHTLLITTAGALWSCGYNGLGNLGLGHTTTPINVFTSTGVTGVSDGCVAGDSISGNLSIILKTNGTLWSCGYNGHGALGLGDTTNRNAFVQIGSATTWAAVVCSSRANGCTVGAVKTDGQFWVWGYNGAGQLGDGSTTNRTSPQQPLGSFQGTVSRIFVSDYNTTCGLHILTTSGAIWGAGYSAQGNLGTSSTASSSTAFVQVVGLTGTVSDVVNVGSSGNGFWGLSVLYTDGRVGVVGDNSGGQLGLGTGTGDAISFTDLRSLTILGVQGPTGPSYNATSTTSLAIATGSKAFTIGTGYAYLAGARVIASSAANSANYMVGTIASYTSGVLTVTVDRIGGSGTKADWNISIANGDPGAGYAATSTSTITIPDTSSGSQSVSLTTQTLLAYQVGSLVRVVSTAGGETTTHWFYGTVTAYTSSTGAMTVSATDNRGAGASRSAWSINIAGQSGDVTAEATSLAAAAAASATAAARSATSASSSASAASTSASAASTSATAAAGSATTASTQATNAASSATSASSSASTATTQASSASTSATSAASSATNAASSATAAANSATNAATSETNAAASATAAASAAAAIKGTSTTSNSIATGAKTFTTQSGKQWTAGQYLLITSDANPSTDYMFGTVTSYSSTSLVMNITVVGGSGTHTDWTINVSGIRGLQGPAGSLDFSVLSAVTPASGDKVAFGDVSNSDTVAYATVAGIIAAAGKAGFDSLTIHGADVASASTIDLDSATGFLVDVTGTTTITAVTLSDGRERIVRFTGALTLTHGSSLVLPGAANITTAAGDCAIFVGYAAGVVRCVSYQKASGKPNVASSFSELTSQAAGLAAAPFGPFTSIASATTTDLSTVATVGVNITGTTTITSFGTGASLLRIVKFAAALTLTHNATSLILPGGANITTAAGDTALFLSDGSGNWTCIKYQKATGKSVVAPAFTDLTSQAAGLAAAPFGPFTALASASTADLSSVGTIGVSITGTTTITSFGTGASLLRIVKFAGALTLTHNATSLILPGGVNITTAAGDRLIALSDGSGNWTVVNYTKSDGTPVSFNFGTSQAVTLGTIELGAASDTTLARLAAGVPTVEGNAVSVLGYTTTATAAGTTTLTVSSTQTQFFTGTSTQTVVLPVTSTLATGLKYRIVNNSTGNVTVQSSGANTILVMGPSSEAEFVCILTSGTSAASWQALTRYQNTPINSQSAAYTTVLSDAGKTILHPSADTTARTFTIDSNANVPYPVGTVLTFVNQASAGTLSIGITTDTMRLSSAGTTGTRTLAANGVATAIKLTTTEWIISGSGLT